MTTQTKGFTLIELLVVIAIIGILSGVVLTAVLGARTKASDEAVHADLANLRTAAELYWLDHQAYGTLDGCNMAGSMFQTDPVKPYIGSLSERVGSLSTSYPPMACNAEGQKYLVAVIKPSTAGDSNPEYFCVDSKGSNVSLTPTLADADNLECVVSP